MKSKEDRLLEQCLAIIAAGCSCDMHCQNDPSGYCGCEDDAKKVIALVKASMEKDNVDECDVGVSRS